MDNTNTEREPKGESLSNDVNIGYKINILLAEYGALRSEIQFRNRFQNSFVWFHVFALSSIVGAFFYTNLGYNILFLIPLESVILYFWYSYQDIKIKYIGDYIRTSIESKARELAGDQNLMQWESKINEERTNKSKKWEGFYKYIVQTTFFIPSLLVLLIFLIKTVFGFTICSLISHCVTNYTFFFWSISLVFTALIWLLIETSDLSANSSKS